MTEVTGLLGEGIGQELGTVVATTADAIPVEILGAIADGAKTTGSWWVTFDDRIHG